MRSDLTDGACKLETRHGIATSEALSLPHTATAGAKDFSLSTSFQSGKADVNSSCFPCLEMGACLPCKVTLDAGRYTEDSWCQIHIPQANTPAFQMHFLSGPAFPAPLPISCVKDLETE